MGHRMRVQLGEQPAAENEMRGLDAVLGDCHERIRRFTRVARRLTSPGDASSAAIVEAASSVARYFSMGLPLHEADEEESLVPRLRGRTAALDAALGTMHDQHGALHDLVNDLVSLTEAIADDPTMLATGSVSTRLADVVDALETRWQEHLDLEESVIFPAASDLPAAERDLIRTEMRLRRV